MRALLTDCLHKPPFDGRGIGGSPLLIDQANISRREGSPRFRVFVPEKRQTIPSGMDLMVDLKNEVYTPVR